MSILRWHIKRRHILATTLAVLLLLSTVLALYRPVRAFVTTFLTGYPSAFGVTPTSTYPPIPEPPLDVTYQGLPITTENIHIGQVFNYDIRNLQDEAGKIDFVWGSNSPDQPAGVYNTYYYPYDREGRGGHNLAWFRQNHPDWIEYQCDRSTVAYEFDNTDAVPLDITNPAVTQYVMETSLVPAFQAGYAAIAFDNVSLRNASDKGRRCGHYSLHGLWVQQFNGTGNDPAYRQAVLAWAMTMYQRIHGAFPTATVAMNFPFDASYPSESYQMYRYLDIDVDEQGFTHYGIARDSFITDADWRANTHALQYLIALGKAFLSINEVPEAFSNISTQEVEWVLANYLLVKGRYSYVYLSGVNEYGGLHLRPEYAARIGSPVGPMTASEHVYMREYTNGLAIVNPASDRTYNVRLQANTYKDLYGHLIESEWITMSPHSGVVFLRT